MKDGYREPLKNGYSWEVVNANAQELHGAHAWASSVAIAYAHARKCFFKRYPGGALPAWLAYPKGHRLAQFYDANGKPRYPLSNPAALHGQISKAAKLFTDFTGRKPDRAKRVRLEPMPKAGLAFGQMTAIEYISQRDGKLYRHAFRPVKSRPLLVATYDGKRMLLLGGAYNFTERGIENAP